MASTFGHFLATKGCLRDPENFLANDPANEFREVLGAIALRHGLMSPSQIDGVLLETCHDRPFEEVAVERGFLDPGQVRKLRRIQELEAALQVGAKAILDGDLNRWELLQELQLFFASDDVAKTFD